MWSIRAVVAVRLACAVVVVAGCQSPTSDETFGTPTPPYQGVPSSEISTPPREDQLYSEAEQIVRNMLAEMEKIERAGGADQLPPEFAQYLAGSLKRDFTIQYQQWKEAEYVLTGQAGTTEWIRKSNQTHAEGSLVSVAVCTDGRLAGLRQSGTPVSVGVAGINTYDFKYFDGKLKAFFGKGREVESCSAR